MNKPQLRSGQIVSTFGPGAMVDLPEVSVIIGGLDGWKYDQASIPTIDEPRLVAKVRRVLQVDGLMLRPPPPAVEMGHGFAPSITAWRFPEWFIVQNPVITSRGHRARRLVHLSALDGQKFRDSDRRMHTVVPVRFVRACRKGHVGDIDWQVFVHGGKSPCPRDLWLEERGTSGDLDEVWVRCECGAERVMSQAARMNLCALGHCDGSRPWLGAGTKESCGEINRLLIRSASNAYFPQLMSVISIPDTHTAVDGIVRSLWENFLSDVESLEELERIRKKPMVKNALEGYADAQVYQAVERVRDGQLEEDRPVKHVEFEALTDASDEIGADVADGDFYARALPRTEWNEVWMKSIVRVVLVHRLREVVAQLGFTRFEAAGPDIQGELELDVQRASLETELKWLPAAENRGEGVFLQFDPEVVEQWLQKPTVQEQGHRLVEGFDLWRASHEGSSRQFPGLPYYMLHSLSHLLMTSIALECGYPASSIRERVYALDGCYGSLLYTGSPDSEGTLGGLVEAGRSIARHMRRALDLGMLCSNDPVCASHAPGQHDYQPLLGSACHGCLLIAETSCEQRNDFLDRSLVVPTLEALGAEFFAAVP